MSLDVFFRKLAGAPGRSLLLDYDGTLAPFRTDRSQAFPYPGVREALNKIMAGEHTRLVLISGRAVADLVQLLGLDQLPEIWGLHGQERLNPDGTYRIDRPEEAALGELAEAFRWAASLGLKDRCEVKPNSLAFHWRGLDQRQIEDLWKIIFNRWPIQPPPRYLKAYPFDGGIELRAPGRDKGDAVKTILSESHPRAVAAFLGDDLTDEDGFRAIKGKGLGILIRPEYRPTGADLWLKPPRELLEFLTNWREAMRG